jgi:hypothetical protein
MDKFTVMQKGYRHPAGVATDLLDFHSETKLYCIFIDVLIEHYKISYNPFSFSKA